MRKELAVAVQEALIARKYDLGPAGADGVFGRKSIAALSKFQIDARLDVKYLGTVADSSTSPTLKALGIDPTKLPGWGSAEQKLPPWVTELNRMVGLRESNPKLKIWLKSDGKTVGDPAKIPWCGDAIQTPFLLTLPNEPMPENPYWALNWNKFGVPLDDFYLGAICTLKRTGGGHVFQVLGHSKTHIYGLGGNQSDSVSVAKFDKQRWRDGGSAIRWPRTYPLPTNRLKHTTMDVALSLNEA